MKTNGLTIIEAIKSGRPFREPSIGIDWYAPSYNGYFSTKDITSNNWEIKIEKKTKRYWLWDIKGESGMIGKDHIYRDDNGFDVAGNPIGRPITYLKKHENEFIEFEVRCNECR